MSSDTIVAIIASLGGLVTAIGGVWVTIRNAGRQNVVANQREFKATRDAWLWAVRTITRMRSWIARQGLDEPPEWGDLGAQMKAHEDRIAGETEGEVKPS